MRSMTTRPLEKRHVPVLVAAEANWCHCSYEFPEDSPISGSYESLAPWAWDEKDILAAAGRYKNAAESVHDTRSWIIEGKFEGGEKREDVRTGKQERLITPCGGMIYEMGETSYDVLLLTVNPAIVPTEADRFDVLETLIEVVLRRAENSSKRHSVRMWVPDGHWELLKFWMVRLKLKSKRIPRYCPDGNDAWLVEYEVTADSEDNSTNQELFDETEV